VEVIVSKGVAVPCLLHVIFSLFQQHWPNSESVKIFIFPQGSEQHRSFIRKLGL
jgi:hypothetical protein